MSWFNGNAMAVMLRPMFPSIFAKVDELEADGTIDKTADLLRMLSTNGTFDALKELAVKIDRHNALLERIADGQAELAAERGGTSLPGPGPSDGTTGDIHGAGVPRTDGTD